MKKNQALIDYFHESNWNLKDFGCMISKMKCIKAEDSDE